MSVAVEPGVLVFVGVPVTVGVPVLVGVPVAVREPAGVAVGGAVRVREGVAVGVSVTTSGMFFCAQSASWPASILCAGLGGPPLVDSVCWRSVRNCWPLEFL